MGLIRFVQKHNENVEHKRIRGLEEQKLRVMQQQNQQQKTNLKYCPHCGKPLP